MARIPPKKDGIVSEAPCSHKVVMETPSEAGSDESKRWWTCRIQRMMTQIMWARLHSSWDCITIRRRAELDVEQTIILFNATAQRQPPKSNIDGLTNAANLKKAMRCPQ